MPDSAGKMLESARKAKDLSLEQVAHNTHIRLRYLEALENDQPGLLPSPIQARGFLRLYAEFLDLDPIVVIQAWNAGISPVNDLAPEGDDASSETRPEADRPSLESEGVEDDLDEGTEATQVSVEPESIKRFNTIGKLLKERRENLGLSLEDVEQVTHIRIHYLKLIEAGQMNELPSLVQARGMLQNFARFLELDIENILLQYAQGLEARRLEIASPDSRKPKKPIGKTTPGKPSAIRRLISLDMLVVIGLLFILVIFVIWSAAQATSARRGATTQTVLPISEILAATAVVDLTGLTLTPTAVFTRPPGEDNLIPTPPAPGEGAPTEAFIDTGVLQIQVIAKQRAWLRVISDGDEIFNARLVPGNAYQFSGNDAVEVTTGNAVAVQIIFNTRDLGQLGVTGQPLSLQFTRAGILTPTAAFSPVPTATPPATVTLAPTPTVQTPTVTPFIP